MTGQTALPGHRYPHRQPAYWARHNCPALPHTTRVVYLVLDKRQGGERKGGGREEGRERGREGERERDG